MIARIAALLWDNPLLVWRLRHETAWTLHNLVLLVMLLLAFFLAWVRWDTAVDYRQYINSLPVAMREAEELTLYGRDTVRINSAYSASFREELAAIYQLLLCQAFLVYLLIVLLGTSFRTRNRWGRMLDDEQRLLPVTPGQRLLALLDWPLLKAAGCYLLAMSTALLPARHIWVQFSVMQYPYGHESLLMSLGVFCVSALLMVHRLIQSFVFRGLIPRRNLHVGLVLGALFFGGSIVLLDYSLGTGKPPILLGSAGFLLGSACLLRAVFSTYGLMRQPQE